MEVFLKSHHLVIGLLADFATFGGALLLARDALFKMHDRQNKMIHEAFKKQFGNLETVDFDEESAVKESQLALWGSLILLTGFILQILSRFSES